MHSAHTPQPCFNFFLLLHTVRWVQYLGPWKQGEKVFVLELSFNILQGGQMRAPILGWSAFYFFDRTEDGTLPKVRYNFKCPNLIFLRAEKFSFSKNKRTIQIFFWNLSFKNYYFGPLKKHVFGFRKKNWKKCFL